MLKTPFLWIALVLFAIPARPATPQSPQAAGGAPAFSNSDVIKLSKLQLGDDVIVAKIKQAEDLSFDLSTDGLVQLKQAGVSGRVIAAMLERTTPSQAAVPAASGELRNFDGPDDVRLIRRNQEIRLPANRGDISTTGMWPVVFTFLDYPGLHARTRTTDVRPALVIRAEHDPKSYYYLGKLDVNDDDDNNRSLKIEQKASGFTATSRVIPAGRWYVEYSASERSPGVWQIVPTHDLEAGEYGVVVPGGVLYEFGVD